MDKKLPRGAWRTLIAVIVVIPAAFIYWGSTHDLSASTSIVVGLIVSLGFLAVAWYATWSDTGADGEDE